MKQDMDCGRVFSMLENIEGRVGAYLNWRG
jgi:hypothetical protein